MYLIGDVSPLARRLVDISQEAMWLGIKMVKPGATLGDIGHAIQTHAESNGYSIVREYCGHGIGKEMHEEPRCCTMVNLVQAKCYRQEWFLPSNRW